MCGIFAALSKSTDDDGGAVMPREAVEQALAALHHRGPDGTGYRFSRKSEYSVVLGQARLAIIGLDDAAGAMVNEDGSVFAVVNGELYDFERIRQELQAEGHRFSTECDSEILVHLYEKYGIDCLSHLRGEFAFVLYDQKQNRLFAARDRFGIKPFVYAEMADKLLFASEAKALFAAGMPCVWDHESFYYSSSIQYVLPDRTLFQSVRQLPPGHMLIFENGLLRRQKYWDLDYSQEKDESLSEKEMIEAYKNKLEEAVKLRLRADTPVCCHLSGGLDSASVVALAAAFSSTPVQCYSVSFGENGYDESAVASAMADHIGGIFHSVSVNPRDLLVNLEDAVYFSEGLAINGHLPAKYLLHRRIREDGFKVTLTGEGADELLAGYAHLREDIFEQEDRVEHHESLRVSNKASTGIMLKQGKSLPLEAVQRKLAYIPAFLQAKGTMGYKIHSVLDASFLAEQASLDCYGGMLESFDYPGQLAGRSRVDQSLYLWTKTALVNYILRTLGDGTEMASSVEGRVPFLDHKLFEFARSLPLSMKIRETTEKYIMREAMRGMVTDEIYKRQKHPFVAPPVSNFSGALAREYLQDVVASADFDAQPFFSKSKIKHFLDRLSVMPEQERLAMDPVFMTVLSAVAVQKRFVCGKGG